MQISKLKVFGWENALIGMRFPHDSDGRMDSYFCDNIFKIGPNDHKLLIQLCIAGKSHRKVLRMVHCQMAIKMPISWWMHMDTYKVATVANSRSRMHTLGKRTLCTNDFEAEKTDMLYGVVEYLNQMIIAYQNEQQLEVKNGIWRMILDILPQSFLQERMWDGSYETLLAILLDRYNKERLKNEWHYFCEYILHNCILLDEIYEVLHGNK